jgi:hypothetical protein
MTGLAASLLKAALNPKFAQIPVFTPHPAFTPEPTPIYDSIYKGRRPSPHLELRFIEHLTKTYSQDLPTVWEDA